MIPLASRAPVPAEGGQDIFASLLRAAGVAPWGNSALPGRKLRAASQFSAGAGSGPEVHLAEPMRSHATTPVKTFPSLSGLGPIPHIFREVAEASVS